MCQKKYDNSITEKRGSVRCYKVSVLIVLTCLLLIAIPVSLTMGRYSLSIGEIFGEVADVFRRFFTSQDIPKTVAYNVLVNIRLPRVLLACMVGCCLSAAGAAYQGVFQNPMASPDILGASNGAGFGAALGILLGASGLKLTLMAFVASIISIIIVFLISLRAHGKRVITLILAGIMISSLFSAGTSFIKLVADPSDKLPAITYWLMGSLAGAKQKDILIALIPMAVGLLPLLLIRWRLNILSLGDDEARALGTDPRKLRTTVIICSTLITATSVSVSGMIGWVGLVIPHLIRKLVGNDYKYLLPGSMLGGALFLLIVDDVSRNLLQTEIPIGILTAVIGAPFFIGLILRKEN